MARVLVICFTDLARDPRVDRQIAFLRGRHEVVAAGLAPPRHPVDEFIDISTPPPSLRGRALGLALVLAHRYETHFWTRPSNIAVRERLESARPDVVVANDIDTLPIALSLGVPVVFDAHEHAPSQLAERRGWRARHSRRIRWLCRRYIPEVATMTTVSQGIADAYEREFGVRPLVVTNAPRFEDLAPTPIHDPVRVVHHGVAQPGRGLEEMVQAAALFEQRFTTDFILVESWPGFREELIGLAAGNPRIRFLEPKPMDTLVRATNDYDIGMFLLPPVNLHRRYALPNKLFEFIQARLAVAIGPSPEMARVVERYGCGIVADDFEVGTFAAAMNALDASAIAGFKRASHAAADEVCAEKNEAIVAGVVESALNRAR